LPNAFDGVRGDGLLTPQERIEALERRVKLLDGVVRSRADYVELSVAAIQQLQREGDQIRAVVEALLFVASGDEISEDARRDHFRAIYGAMKQTGLMRDLEALLDETSRDARADRVRDLLRRASSPPVA
jgi:hypothetical protein